jgi:predicted SAM-dependent methyltransferase
MPTLRKILLFLLSHRALAIVRWDLHLLRLRIRNAITLQNRRIWSYVAARPSPLFLNLGSGPRGIDDAHWINVDAYYGKHVHYLLDFTRKLPFADQSFNGVFCEHVLEHFSFDCGESLAREVYRILRPGGFFRIIVPDGELILRRYFEAPNELIAWRGDSCLTAMQVVNSYFRQRYEHEFLHDFVALEKLLRCAGFTTVSRADFGRGVRCNSIVLDDPKYQWESLYVEAQKQLPANMTRDPEASRATLLAV